MPDRLARRRRLIVSLAVPLLAALFVSSISAAAGGVATSGGDTSPVNLATPIKLADGVASHGAVVTAGRHARFEVLTSGVIRMEYSPTGSFLDTPTWNIINRHLPVPSYSAKISRGVLTIRTSAMVMRYQVGSGPFGPTNTTVRLLDMPYSDVATIAPTWSGECVYGQACQSNTATLKGGTSLTINNANFVSQGGEISGLGTSGSTARWNVLGVPAAGSGTVTIRYDNGSGATSSMSLVVDGQTYPLSLPATGGWDKWSTVTQNVALNSGTNTVLATCPNSAACNLTVDTIGVTAVGATPRPALPAGQLGGYNRSYDNATYSAGNLPSAYQAAARPAAGGTTCGPGQSGDTCTDNVESLQPGLLDTSGWFMLDDTHTAVWTSDGWTAARPAGDIEDGYLFGYGKNYQSALADLAKLTGHAPMLPEPLFGNWYSDFHAYSESDYKNTILPAARANGVSLDDLSVDTYWHSPDIWASWEFNSTLFPNPPEFFAWANGQHLHVDLAVHGQIPVSDTQAPATLAIAGGSLAQAGCPTFGPSDTCYVFDWSNKAQAEAYFNLVQKLSNDGANFYWLDWCCEASVVSNPGVDPDGWIAQLSARQMIDNGARGFILARAGASNLQPLAGRYPSGAWADHRSLVHFTGDATATWGLLSDEIQRTTGEASIGEPYVSDDIGGFYAPPGTSNDPDDLYLRFVQFGVFQPIMRLHSSNLNRLPWQFDASTQAVGDAFLRLRESLVPYLYSLSSHSVSSGQPMAQALYLDYPDRAAAYKNPDEYLLGSRMLVAPVTTPGTDPRTTVWFPPGTWTDWFTGATYVGPRTRTLSMPLNQMPVFVKAGGIVPLQPSSGHADTADSAPLTLKVYAGANGRYHLYEDAGKGLGYQRRQSRTTPVTYSQSGTSSTLTVGPAVGSYPGAPARRSYRYQLVGVSAPTSVLVNGQPVSTWSYNPATATLKVTPPPASVTQPLTITERS
jgi:alpha-glucosidase (family GH31 glycosyl hydrolase)